MCAVCLLQTAQCPQLLSKLAVLPVHFHPLIDWSARVAWSVSMPTDVVTCLQANAFKAAVPAKQDVWEFSALLAHSEAKGACLFHGCVYRDTFACFLCLRARLQGLNQIRNNTVPRLSLTLMCFSEICHVYILDNAVYGNSLLLLSRTV